MARPPKDEADRLRNDLRVRMRDADYEEIKEAAQASGLELSSWARARLLSAARREGRKK